MDFQRYEVEHIKNLLKYSDRVKAIYEQVIEDILQASYGFKPIPGKAFSFDDFPELRKRANKAFQEMASELESTIVNGITNSWGLSNIKNDRMVRNVLGGRKTSANVEERFFNHNIQARDQFIKRKESGMALSDRVWRSTEQFRMELENGMQVGVTEGISSRTLATEMKKYLNEPENLFRRVRDAQGRLQLSKRAAAYHPGQGTYRSSYKNSLRMARTEMNMAYRYADHERWKELPFILGFEVRLSGRHPAPDICDEAKGKYPVEFKFSGWHPQCLCHAVPITADDAEFSKVLGGVIDEGKIVEPAGKITDVPSGFKDWVEKNKGRVKGWKSTPYFIKDNFKNGDIAKGLSFEVKQVIQPEVRVKEQEPIKRQVEYKSRFEPPAMESYPIKINQEIYDLIGRQVDVTFDNRGSRAYNNYAINITKDQRWKRSKAFQKSVIYHEFGHAADYSHRWRFNEPKVNMVMDSHRKQLGANINEGFRSIHTKINIEWERLSMLPPDYMDELGFTKYDLMEQTNAMADTICSLNKDFGWGHSKAYFSEAERRNAEFIAHCFENRYAGNAQFKKMFPELYEDMVELCEELIKKAKR